MDSGLTEVVRDVCRAAEGLGVEVVLVGALMTELTPEKGSDYPQFRRTNDADFGVRVRDWPTYEKLREKLLGPDCKFEPDRSIEHRLHRRTAMVDLIPYGAEIAPGGTLVWPKSEFEMSVVGFDEVCAAASKVKLEDGPSVSVITVPGFVLLKIIAFLDRKAQGKEKHKDDAKDIDYWLQNYVGGTEDDRRYDLANKPGIEHEDYATAGAVLLGMEVGALASEAAAECVARFLSESKDLYSPFLDILAAGVLDVVDEQKRKEGLALLAAFKKGYKHRE
ncbi:MAG: hypothetical protein ABIJ96_02740 [Elusimicrobiota bacterium]